MTTHLRSFVRARFALLLALLAVALMVATPVDAAVTGKITISPVITETSTTDLGTGGSWTISDAIAKTITNGTGVDQANKIFADEVTLAGSGSTNFDLDGTLTGTFGTVTFSRIHTILIWRTNLPAASTQDENLTVGGDFYLTKVLLAWVDDALTDSIGPGGILLRVNPNATGYAVTATTGDVLTVTNASSADSCTYRIVIIGS